MRIPDTQQLTCAGLTLAFRYDCIRQVIDLFGV